MVYFLISRFELRIIYRGDDRRCLDYGFDDVLSCTTSPSPPECNKRVVIATIERYRVLSSAIGKKKHERILFVVTRTIHLIIQPTRGCIIVALIIPITVQLSFTCNAGDVMHSLASTQWRENSFIGEAGRRANCFSSEIGRWNPLENASQSSRINILHEHLPCRAK